MHKILGLYDSGLGGYSVYHFLKENIENANLVLFADTKYNPYGSKSKEELLERAIFAMEFFETKGIKDVVVACNTISATVLSEIIKRYPHMSIYGIIEITANSIPKEVQSISVVSTPNTSKSRAYSQNLPDKRVLEIPIETLAYEIENSLPTEIKKKSIAEAVENVSSEVLILGCTHYPLEKGLFSEFYQGEIYDSNEPILKLVKTWNISRTPNIQEVYVSGDTKEFESKVKAIFGDEPIVRSI